MSPDSPPSVSTGVFSLVSFCLVACFQGEKAFDLMRQIPNYPRSTACRSHAARFGGLSTVDVYERGNARFTSVLQTFYWPPSPTPTIEIPGSSGGREILNAMMRALPVLRPLSGSYVTRIVKSNGCHWHQGGGEYQKPRRTGPRRDPTINIACTRVN